MRPHRALSPQENLALERLRGIAGSLPGSVESVTFTHPTFKVAGRTFAVLDRYHGRECLWLRVDPMERAGLLAASGWFESPYDPRRTALCCDLESIDWRRMRALVRRSHALAGPGPAKRGR
jgi:predicted DNA-binding protein (MmcQ/YjbR family)